MISAAHVPYAAGTPGPPPGNPYWRRGALSAGSLILILLALIPTLDAAVGFDFAVLPMLLGGAAIAYPTLVAMIERRRVTAGTLVVIAVVGSAYLGEYMAAAVVSFMMLAGEFLEELTLRRTRDAVRELVRLAPDVAWIERRGACVFAGTTNRSGTIVVRADRVGRETTLGRIIQVVRAAQDQKGSVQKVADRFATFFTPAVLGIGALVWGLSHDLERVMAVFVVACPCALVLATPTAVVVSVGGAARR